ncbi:hypothetical protein FQN50_000448 [Emmonsiellopsis sp. PD_5]|nr:hypothetical protein FQN50_000448 [Emmonsiellopsis sp. PD_5]
MAAVAVRAFNSVELHGKFGNPQPSINVTDIGEANMYPRYESEEEEISEAEIAGRTEPLFSPIENDSDTGASESEEANPDLHAFTLQIPSSPPEAALSRTGSTSTVKRSSCITLMPPLPPRADSISSLYAPSTPSLESPKLSALAEPILVPTHITEEEAISYYRSFYSDAVSSDDEYGTSADASFLVATPVAYYAPSSKPHLISIDPPARQVSSKKATKKQKKQELATVTRKISTKSTRSNASIKGRVSTLKIAKNSKRRESSILMSEPAFSSSQSPSASPAGTKFSNASTPSFSTPNWGANTLYDSDSEPESFIVPRVLQNTAPLSSRKHNLLPSPRISERKSGNKRHQRAPESNSSTKKNDQGTEDKASPSTKKKTKIPPVPQLTGIAISSNVSSPLSSAASLDSPGVRSFQDQPPIHHAVSSAAHTTRPNYPSGGVNDMNPPLPTCNINNAPNFSSRHPTQGLRERTYSVSSMASITSMPNYPSPDNASTRSGTHRYRQRFYPADTASERPSSRESMGPGLRPYPNRSYTYTSHGSVSTTNLSNPSTSATSTSTPTSTSRLDVNNSLSWNFHTGRWSPLDGPKHHDTNKSTETASSRKHSRAKSIKRLYETSETVSRAGSKAFTGLGSMLRKKNSNSPTPPPADEGMWNPDNKF